MDIAILILQGIGILIGVFVVYLLIVALIPGISVPKQELQKSERTDGVVDIAASYRRKDVTFDVKGTPVSAWLYFPDDLSSQVPCVVMGHGAGGTKDMGLESYALRFVEAGFAALLFDYRHFGRSGGEPRQLLWIPYQLEDYSGAVEYARGRDEIDPAKIALWGTSCSGGHVIVRAAKDQRIACVVAQCPGLDGLASSLMAFKRGGNNYRTIIHAQRDMVRSYLRLSPHKIPIIGKPGSIACLTAPDAADAFGRLLPEDFVNEVCARIVIRGDKYRPVKKAHRVRCPVLLQICEDDFFTPMSAANETEKKLGEYAEVKHYPIGHFDIYFGEHFEKSVSDQLEFLRRHLL